MTIQRIYSLQTEKFACTVTVRRAMMVYPPVSKLVKNIWTYIYNLYYVRLYEKAISTV